MKLHLGCGYRYLPGFIHIDMNDDDHIDHIHRIDQLPMIENETIDEIYASNCFEYFDREEAKGVLKEWRRTLKPGGILRLSVPNFESIIKVYQYDTDAQGILGPLFGRWPTDGGEMIYHKTVYDETSMTRLLMAASFQDIELYNWQDFLPRKYDDFSKAYMPHMDESGIHMALNMKATR